MVIQWFPGHMHKARKGIAAVIRNQDVVIEVLDARLPYSSANPLVDELTSGKPRLRVLTRSDLADPAITKRWLRYFAKSDAHLAQVIAFSAAKGRKTKPIIQACGQLVPDRGRPGKPVRALVVGIPNVGKSTLINALAGRRIAKVGDEPAVTRGQQRVAVHDSLAVCDTPGVLWPRLSDLRGAHLLAASGAIRDTVLQLDDIAQFLLRFLAERYASLVRRRYNLETLPDEAFELLACIGKSRGCLAPGGDIDMHAAANLVLRDFRTGRLGRISLELPEGLA